MRRIITRPQRNATARQSISTKTCKGKITRHAASAYPLLTTDEAQSESIALIANVVDSFDKPASCNFSNTSKVWIPSL